MLLKTVVDNNQFRMESTVVEIKPSILPNVIFAIDGNIPVKKMN